MRFVIILLSGLILDQFTKWLVYSNMAVYQSIPVIPNIFHITYVQNQGAAFSILQGRFVFFVIITSVALACLGYIIFKTPKHQKAYHLVFPVLLAGILGNFIDRLRFQYVVDFFDFRIFPIFNIADSMLVCSIIILIFLMFMDSFKESKAAKLSKLPKDEHE